MRKMTLVVLAVTQLTWMTAAHAAAEMQVIANESVKESTISKDELKQILLANKTAWSDGKPIAIVTLAPGSDEADNVDKEAMGMTSVQAKKHWLTKVFNGVLPSAPVNGDSPDDVVEAVAKTPGAIAVVPAGTKPGKAKVLSVK